MSANSEFVIESSEGSPKYPQKSLNFNTKRYLGSDVILFFEYRISLDNKIESWGKPKGMSKPINIWMKSIYLRKRRSLAIDEISEIDSI